MICNDTNSNEKEMKIDFCSDLCRPSVNAIADDERPEFQPPLQERVQVLKFMPTHLQAARKYA